MLRNYVECLTKVHKLAKDRQFPKLGLLNYHSKGEDVVNGVVVSMETYLSYYFETSII